MTLATTASTSGPYNCNGATVAFSYAWKILDDDEIEVTLISSAGVRTTLTKTTHYTVSGVDNPAGGTVTTVSTYAAGYQIYLRRKPPFSQTSAFENQGAFNASAVDEALDKLAMQGQYLRDEVTREVKVPLGEDGLTLAAADARAGMLQEYDEDGASKTDRGFDAIVTAAGALVGADALAQIVVAGGVQVDAVEAAGALILTPVTGSLAVAEAAVVGVGGTIDDREDVALAALGAAETAAIEAVAATPGSDQYASTANALSNGVWSVAITAGGSGGTGGTYNWTTTGGAGADAAGYLTVAGGAISNVVVTHRGAGYTSNPTIVIAGAHGVTGHTLTPAISQNQVDGTYFIVKVATGFELFENVSGVATSLGVYPANAADLPLTSGELFDATARTEYGLFNGATIVTSGARSVGFTIPAGQTGINSFLILVVDVSGVAPELAGEDVRFTLTGTMTAGMLAAHPFIPSNLMTVTDKDDVDTTSAGTPVSMVQDGTTFTRIHDYTFTGEEKVIRLLSQIEGTSVTDASPMTVTLTGAAYELTSVPANAGTKNDAVLRARIAQQTGRKKYARIITVDASGADFTTVGDALDSITYASPTNWVCIKVSAGTYNEVNLYHKDFVDIVGEYRDTTEISYELAANTAPATIAAATILWLNTNSGLFNITLRIKNGRYPLHADGANSEIYRNGQQVVRNVRLIHEGNEDAKAYQATVGGNVGNGWNSTWLFCNAWGGGVCSGQDVVIEDCEFQAPWVPFALHGIDAAYVGPNDVPARYALRRNRFFSTETSGTRYAADFSPEDSPAGCDILLEDNDFTGGLITCQAASDEAASRFRITGSGNTAAAFYLYGGATATRPLLSDEEGRFLNDTGSTLPAKAALAYDGAFHKVREMTSADAASLFAGVAIEAIADGASGRVKSGGAVLLTDLLRDDATGVGFGTTFSIGTAGRVVVGGSQGLLFGGAEGDRVRLRAL